MDTSKTQFHKSTHDGWHAKDTIEMGPAKDTMDRDGVRVLQIETYKRYHGGIHTYASCAVHRDNMITTELFGDYSKTVAKIEGVKCTEKAIKTLHATVMAEQADAILAEARDFYAKKDAAKALNAKRDAELESLDANPAQTLTSAMLGA